MISINQKVIKKCFARIKNYKIFLFYGYIYIYILYAFIHVKNVCTRRWRHRGSQYAPFYTVQVLHTTYFHITTNNTAIFKVDTLCIWITHKIFLFERIYGYIKIYACIIYALPLYNASFVHNIFPYYYK